MDDNIIKVGVIGTGRWAIQQIEVFKKNKYTKICAIAGRNDQKVKEIADKYNINGYFDISNMYKFEALDLVSICINGMYNYEYTLYAIKQGVPLLIEKPISFFLEEANQIVVEIEKENLFASINFMHRFGKPVQNAYNAIKKNKLGDIVFFIWKMEHEGSCNEHEFRNIIESQCHGIDLIEYLCGEIDSVMAEMTDITKKGYTTLSVTFKLKNGSIGSYIGSYDSIDTYRPSQFMEISGTKAKITIKDFVRAYTFQNMGSEEIIQWEPSLKNLKDFQYTIGFDKHITEICRALILQNGPPINVRSGLRALHIAYKIIESFKTGKRVLV